MVLTLREGSAFPALSAPPPIPEGLLGMGTMTVRMKEQILGTHPDHDTDESVGWPAPGDTVTLEERQAVKLVANGSAVPVDTRSSDVEKRGPGRPRKTTYDNT